MNKGESHDTPSPPGETLALPPAGKEEEPTEVAHSGEATAPGTPHLARVQPPSLATRNESPALAGVGAGDLMYLCLPDTSGLRILI